MSTGNIFSKGPSKMLVISI